MVLVFTLIKNRADYKTIAGVIITESVRRQKGLAGATDYYKKVQHAGATKPRDMSQIFSPLSTQICAPVPHSKLIQTITRCAQNAWCNPKFSNYAAMDTTDRRFSVYDRLKGSDNNNDEKNEFNREIEQDAGDEMHESLSAVLDSADCFIDEDALLDLAYSLGLDNEKFELPDLCVVSETSVLSCLR